MGRLVNIYLHKKRIARNLRAFNNTMDEYKVRKYSCSVRASNIFVDGEAPNPASPSYSDFVCDVEKVIKDSIDNPKLLTKFIQQFILDLDVLDFEQRNRLQQRIGRTFISRGIWPVKEYFHTIRKNKYEPKRGNDGASRNY